MLTSDSVVASDGLVLRVRTVTPPDPPRAVVQILHGMAEHAARYDALARRLAESGYAVVVHDQRGHGDTSPDALGHLGDRDGWLLLVEDARRVGTAARDRFPGLPFVLLGHSMGSVVARTLVQFDSESVDGLVLSGPPADQVLKRLAGRALARGMAAALGSARRNPVLDRLTFGSYNAAFAPTRTRFDWLSRDARAVDDYVADPRCGFVCTSGFFVDLLDGVRLAGDRHRNAHVRPDLPVYVLAGEEDPAGRRGAAVSAISAAYRRAGLRDVATRLYPGGRHEMFHETDREVVVADLLSWLDRCVERAAARPVADVIPLRRKDGREGAGRKVGSCR